MTTSRVKGLSEMSRTLQQLPAKVEKNILRAALAAGARVVAKEARALAPKETGELARGIRVSTDGRYGKARAFVKTTGPHAYIAPWLEFGTAAHKIVAKDGKWLFFGGVFAKSIEHPGITPRPFFRPAIDQTMPAAINAVAERMRQRIEKHGLDTPDTVGIRPEDEGN